ncbi:MAG: AAA domain-containing protein [Saprospiraceae bacterium]
MEKNIQDIFEESLDRILISTEYTDLEKTKALFNLLSSVLEEMTEDEKIIFTTLFSRASFVANRYKVDSTLMYYLHTFRRDNERMKIKSFPNSYVGLGKYVIDNIIDWVWNGNEQIDVLPKELSDHFAQKQKEVVQFRPVVETIIDSVNIDNYEVYFYDDEDPTELKTALFDKADKNEIFNESIELIDRSFSFPMHANLIDVEVLDDGKYLPNAIVIEPDYLLDVTAIANCFKPYGSESMSRLISKFKPIENSIPLVVGNIANLFLDEIISNPDVKFKDLIPGIFKLSPLAMTVFTDDQIRKMMADAKNHYLNLKRTVALDLPKQGIHRNKVFLEPSFYSRDYGLQGRLDLFHYNEAHNQYDIVELKSGGIFRANVYGLNANHYSQTLLYDLMIKSTFGFKKKPNNYILYSKLSEQSLKYAPPVKSQQYEAMKVRNDLIAIEYKLANSATDAQELFDYVKSTNFPKTKGFELSDIEKFEKLYKGLSNCEKSYFNEYSSFISREQRLAKSGEHGIYKSNGLSALWLENMDEKEERFGLLKELEIKENKSKHIVPTIILSKTENTNKLANFREGDIAVLYPHSDNPRAVLKNQIFKCTILSISDIEIEVKLRSRQYNDSLFSSILSWNIESDSLDSGFNMLYRSLSEFINARADVKNLWLGSRPPKKGGDTVFEDVTNLTDEQNLLLDRMTNSKDYFLLWGPPGTGKTSVMLKSLVERLYKNSDENILLLAYTNRAVDEMCAAIESIGTDFKNNYIRIGSETSCGKEYRPRLINKLIGDMDTRIAIKKLIKSNRIFISTVSSIVSKSELFKLKNFDRVIIDEASQILEPMLLGLLSRVAKAVLIGDHKQLPAVVTQRIDQSKIVSQDLLALGITDMRMSLFERLYHQCRKNNWDQALGLLSLQGRMHQELMVFPNQHFYENKLGVLPHIKRLVINRELTSTDIMGQVLIENRFIYIPTRVDDAFNWKTNKHEAKKVMKVLDLLQKLYSENNETITNKTIGVITPYRAQIATIRQQLEIEFPDLSESITIDTVERYQGGARDIIILSLCTNRLSQLRSLVSLSHEGIDRKLNVAITRAREQMVILGNRKILAGNDTYTDLINAAFEWRI